MSRPTCPPRYVLHGNVRYHGYFGRFLSSFPAQCSEPEDRSDYGRAMRSIWDSYFGLAHGTYGGHGEWGHDWLKSNLKRALRDKVRILVKEDRSNA